MWDIKILDGKDTIRQPINKSLNAIATEYMLDKADADEHDFLWHQYYHLNVCLGYAPKYDTYFKDLREREIRLLEIGVKSILCPFGSMHMWLDYFHKGKVAGMDILDIDKDSHGIDEIVKRGATYISCDQGDKDALRLLTTILPSHGFPEFDIIIDDGSHNSKDIWTSLVELWPTLKSGGFYCIEDVTGGWPEPRGSLLHGDSSEVFKLIVSPVMEGKLYRTPTYVSDIAKEACNLIKGESIEASRHIYVARDYINHVIIMKKA